jgi:hypothetical protein
MTLPALHSNEILAQAAPCSGTLASTSPGAQVQIYRQFAELPPSLSGLFDCLGQQDFFLSQEWFRNFAQNALDHREQPRIYGLASVDCQDRLAGMLLMRAAQKPRSAFSSRKLESFTNYYSCFFGPHVDEHSRLAGKTLLMIASAIAQEKPAWDCIEIKPMDVNSKSFSAMIAALEGSGFLVQKFFAFGNWYLPVNSRTYAEYSEQLPSVLRNTIARKEKKLLKTGRARIEIVTGGNSLEVAIQDYTKVYLSSWKKPEPFPQFVPGLVRTCAAMGTLRLGIVHLDDEPIAAQLWIVHQGRALIYKLAYDERFSELSAGTVLSARLFKHAIDSDKVSEIDYLSGDDDYKKSWMSHRRERWGILALNPRTLRGNLAIVRHFGGRAVKQAALSVASKLGFRKGPISRES